MLKRLLLILALLTAQLAPQPALASKFGTKIFNKGGLKSAIYDTRFGTATDASGWITFGLKPGAKRVWVNSSGGNDANDCLSAAAACATYDHAFTIWQNGLTAGDQLMIAGTGGRTYSDSISGTCCYGVNNFSSTGVSAQYPYAVLSYDPADAANTAKYGKLVGSDLPVLQLTAQTPSLSIPVGSGNGNLAIQGIEIKGRSAQLAYQSDNLQYGGGAGAHPNLAFQNDRFNNAGISFNQLQVGNISKSSFIGGAGIYSDGSGSDAANNWRDLWIQDIVIVHAGWGKIDAVTGGLTASRYDTVANGAAQPFTHPFYLHAGTAVGTIRLDRILSIDSSNEGIGSRAGAIGSQWVSIDSPAAFLTAGFSNALTEQPSGALFQLDDAAAIGSDVIDATHPAAGVFQVDNMLTTSYARNVAVFDDSSSNKLFNYVRKYDSGGEIANIFLLDKLSTWNAGIDSGEVSGSIGYVDSQTPTRQTLNITNSVIQSSITASLAWSVPGTTSYTWTSTLSGSALTNVTSRSSSPAGYKTKVQVLSALGFASKAAFANAAAYRPDLPWANAILTIALPAMGLTPQYSTVSPPSVTSPPAYYATSLGSLTLSSNTFTRGSAKDVVLSGTSANFTLSCADLPTGFTLTGRLIHYDGSGSGAASPTIHVLETSTDTLGTNTSALALSIS